MFIAIGWCTGLRGRLAEDLTRTVLSIHEGDSAPAGYERAIEQCHKVTHFICGARPDRLFSQVLSRDDLQEFLGTPLQQHAQALVSTRLRTISEIETLLIENPAQ